MSLRSRRLFGLLTYPVLVLSVIGTRSVFGATSDTPQSFTLDGQLLQAGTQNPLLDSAAKITVDVLDPSRTCVLYEEQQTVNTSTTNGYYNIQVGTLSTLDPKRTASDPHNTMAQVYQNVTSIAGTSAPGQTCAGGVYVPASGDVRYFRITVTPSATGIADTLSPDTVLSAVPTAIAAQTLDGLDQSSFLQVNTSGGANLTQANLNFLFTGTAYSNLQNIESGNYLQSSSSGAADLPSYTNTSPPSTPSAGSVWYNSTNGSIQYYDGSGTKTLASGSGVTSVTVSNRLTANGTAGGTFTTTGTIDLNSSGVTAGTYPKVTVDTYGRVTAGTTLASTDIPTLTTPGQVSGNAITSGTIGGSTVLNTSGNITTSGNISATNVSANAANFRSITLTNGSSQTETIQPSAAITGTPTFTLPGTTGTANQVLTTDGSGNLSWTTVGTGSGTVTSVGLSMPSIFTVSGSPVTTSGTLTAALASQTANTVLAAPNGSAGAPTFRSLVAADLPTSGVTAGTYKSVTVDTYGRVTAGTNPTTLSGYGITDGMQNLGGSPGVETGADSSKPASPGAGTIYMATDTKKVYQYNSGAWTMMASAAGSGGTVTSITAGTGLTGGTITGSGTIALANPSATTIGGVESIAPVSHEWINSISTSGVPSLSQPSFSDLTGTVAATQMPALTGDVTSTAGSTATTVVGIQGVSVNSTAPTTSGQVLRYDTTTSKYVPNFLGVADIRSTVSPYGAFFPTNCTSGETLTYSSPTDTYVCTTISVSGTNFGSETANTFLAAPNGSAGNPTFRTIASADLPASGVSAGTYKSVTVDTTGRVTAGTNPTTLSGYGITDGVQNAGGTPAIQTGLDASKPASPGAGTIYMATDSDKIYQYNSGAWSIMSGSGTGGSVTSVGLSDGSTTPIYTVSGSPVTTSGTLSFTLNTQAKNTVLAGPTTGSNAQPTFRGLVAADLPTSGVTAGTYNSVTVDTYGRVTAGVNPTTLSGYGITDGMQNLGGSPGVETGLDSSKPASPGAGTIYMATDTKKVYQYNSGAWTMMASAAGSGGTVTSITAGTGLTGGTITGSGTIALATPTTSTIGGVEAIAPVSHEWINSISTSGVPSLSQPSFSDLTGTVAATQMPALTGDVTSTAGSTATTVVGIQGVSVNSTAPTTSGQVLRYDTTTSKYVPNFIGLADIRSTVSGNAQFFPTNCTSGETLTYSSPTDTYVCTTISVSGTNFGAETANTFLAAPNGSAGNPTFRTIAAADLPASGVSAGTYKSVTVDTTGRVTAGTNPTTLSGFGITDGVQNLGGSPGVETGADASKPVSPGAGTIYMATDTNKIYQYNSGAWATMGGGGSGTVTSVGMSLPSMFTVSGSPVTTSGTLSATLASQTANTVLAAPNGSAGAPTFRSLVAADLPTSGVTAGTYKSVTVDTYGRVTAGTNPTTLSGYGITDGMQNLGGSPGVETGLDSSKPASPGAGTIYMATDTKKVYQYNSGAWTMMASAAGSGGTVTSITAGTGLTGGTITGSGTIALANPSATTIGGVESIAPVSHEWVNSISTSGVPSLSQPSFSDLTGTVAATQMPALTGDVTSTAGSTATAVVGIQGVSVNSTAPTTSGQVLRYDTTTSKYVPNFLGVADIRSTVSPYGAFFPTNCTSGETLTYSSPTDTYVCTTISVSGTNFGSETANTFLAAPNGSAGNPTFRTIASADLPATVVENGGNSFGANATIGTNDTYSLGLKTNNSTRMTIDSSGNVDVGSAAPVDALSISATPKASATHALVNLTNTALSGASASGTYIGANPATAGADFINYQVGGASKYKVDSAGNVTATSFTGSGSGLTGVLTSSAVSGTTNYISKFSGANSVGNSGVTDDGTTIGTSEVVSVSANSASTGITVTQTGTGATAAFHGNVGIYNKTGIVAAPIDPLSVGATPSASATDALVNLTNTALSGASASGTYIGANPSSAGADFINYQVGGTSKYKVDSGGNVTSSGTITATSFTGSGAGLTGVLATSAVSGTTNYISKFSGANSVGNSGVTDNGTTVGTSELVSLAPNSTSTGLTVAQAGTGYAATITGGNVGIGTTAPGFPLEVSSTVDNTVQIDTNHTGGANGWSQGLVALNPNMSSGETYMLKAGQADSQYNDAYLGFVYWGPNNGDNYVTLGLYNRDGVLVVNGNGNLGVDATLPIDPLSIGEAPPASATDALVNLSNTHLSGGSASGTYIGANPASAGADFVNYQVGNASKFKVDSTGNTTATSVRTNGQVSAQQYVVATGATVDFNNGNVQVLQSVGGSTITLNNMQDGGAYTVIVSDPTSRTYTFSGCTNKFQPANAATTANTWTVYTILKVTISGTAYCMISWIPGF